MRAFIAAYERARRAIHERRVPLDVAIAKDEAEDLKWHARLRQAVKTNKRIEFEEDRIRLVLYRPFQQLWLYEDDRILSSVKTIAAMFPRDGNDPPPRNSILVSRTSQLPFGTIASRILPDLCVTGRQTHSIARRRPS